MNSLEKLEKEFASAKKLSPKAKAMKQGIYNALCEFCRQNAEFAQAVEQSDKTLTDCCKTVAEGVGDSISDLEAYTKAVQFYFSGAIVKFRMEIYMSESEAEAAENQHNSDTAVSAEPAEAAPPVPNAMSISLDSLLDF